MSDLNLTRQDLEDALLKSQGELMTANEKLESTIEKMQGEIEVAQSASTESKNTVEKLSEKANELAERCMNLEQRETDIVTEAQDSIGSQFVKSANYLATIERGYGTARMETKTAIVNTFPATTAQPLVQGDRQSGIFTVPNRRLTLKDLIPNGTTTSNLVEYTRENALTSRYALAA